MRPISDDMVGRLRSSLVPLQRAVPAHAALLDRLAAELSAAGSASECALALDMLETLSVFSPDSSTVAAALLAARAMDDPDPIDESLPPATGNLVAQFRRVVHYDRAYLPTDQSRAEGLRRLILAMIADVRVVLIVLAWQLARMRMAADTEERRALALETRLIHAPLANRLGLWHLKWQLEDLAFKYLEPETYQRVSRLIAERQADREKYIERFMTRLRGLLEEAGITHEISGRAKHIYSIWRKMQRKGLDFHQLFDIRAVRVLVESVADCYAALGLVHAHWQPVPGEFDDYISNPKPNLYKSLHTAVGGPEGRVIEVQIRTFDMHAHAEYGVAAHWRYKEGGPRDDALEARVGAMRQLIEAADGPLDDASLLENFESLTNEDRVYALTPRGEVVDLAAGATALDFAYHIHTEVGHRCRGAKVNGRIVPLTRPLETGDRVEILTAREPRPSRDWLNPGLGYLRTGRARAKVRHYFRQANYDDNLAAGRQAVESELKRLALAGADLGPVADGYNFQRVDDLLAAVGAGEYTASQVAQAVIRLHPEAPAAESIVPLRKPRPGAGRSANEIHIEGVGSLLHQLAGCCQPVPGDQIGGFITRQRGVSIHRQDCRQYLRLITTHPERAITVHWGQGRRPRYPARLLIEAWDRRELIKDVGSVLNTTRGRTPEQVQIELGVEVSDLGQLAGLLGRLQSIPNVSAVRRVR